ncbi:MAG: hypothetical protein K2G47_03135 [Muribaculum sp.]|nr:hypothetical protein [Muribaculum sp.]
MIYLNQIYIGNNPANGKSSSIILHDTTIDICTPDYKRGTQTTVSYSSVKSVCASGNTLILNIIRTEVILSGLDSTECSDIAKIIEIGRREPVESSKAFRLYKKEAERREAKEEKAAERREAREAKAAERREAREAKIAAITDSINRYTETRAINRETEAEIEQQEKDKLRLAEDQISELLADFSDTEEQIALLMSKLNVLFNKYIDHSESDYQQLSGKVLEIYRENMSILEEKFPESEITIRTKSQLEKFERKKKEKEKNDTIGTILGIAFVIVFIAVYFILEKFGIISK